MISEGRTVRLAKATGALLGLGRDRVFEVKDQRVGRQRAGLFERARIGARHVEDAAARADRRGHRSPLGFERISSI